MNIYDLTLELLKDSVSIKKWSDPGVYPNAVAGSALPSFYYVSVDTEFPVSIHMDKPYYYGEDDSDFDNKYNIVNLVSEDFIEVINNVVVTFYFDEITFEDNWINAVVVVEDAVIEDRLLGV